MRRLKRGGRVSCFTRAQENPFEKEWSSCLFQTLAHGCAVHLSSHSAPTKIHLGFEVYRKDPVNTTCQRAEKVLLRRVHGKLCAAALGVPAAVQSVPRGLQGFINIQCKVIASVPSKRLR